MLKVDPDVPSDRLLKYLIECQQKVNLCANHKAQGEEAVSIWSRLKHKDELRISLRNLGEVCAYCEQNEESDIEHILPKKAFPHLAFQWENYLMACARCNRDLKKDKGWVFVPVGSANGVELQRNTPPPTNDWALVHPRKEDPLELMRLDFKSFFWFAAPSVQPRSRDFFKVEHTLGEEMLDLNRSKLVKNRKNAFGNFKRLAMEYLAVYKATDFEALQVATLGQPTLDEAAPFARERARILRGLEMAFKEAEHLSVWREMCRRSSELGEPLAQMIDELGVLNARLVNR